MNMVRPQMWGQALMCGGQVIYCAKAKMWLKKQGENRGVAPVFHPQTFDWTSRVMLFLVSRFKGIVHVWKQHLTYFHRARAALCERRNGARSLEDCRLAEVVGKIWQPHAVISQDSAEIRGYKQRRYCCVSNKFPNLKSRSAVRCHKSAALFTQTSRLSQVVTGKAFSGWRAASTRKPIVKMISFQLLHLVNCCGLCQADRMEEICACKRPPQTLALFSPRNQIVLLFCFLRPACNVASKCPLPQVCEQVACGLPDLATDCCVRLSVK